MDKKTFYDSLNNIDIFEDDDIIERLSKTAVEYAFRSGPIERLHGEGKLSDEDMKELNIYMLNRIAAIFTLMKEGRNFELRNMISFNTKLDTSWDRAVPDLKASQLTMNLFENMDVEEFIKFTELDIKLNNFMEKNK